MVDLDKENTSQVWSETITGESSLFSVRVKDVWNYRDLLLMLVKRDFVAFYKQTVLGPVWFFIQPFLTTLMFVLVFGKIAGLSTDGIPMLVFYLSGITMWGYFSECLNKTATVFKDNAALFGKVYFPRLIMPLSIVVSNLIRLGIQLSLFLIVWVIYLFKGASIHPNLAILYLPLLIVIMAILALGLGMMISALTTKYRDLVFLMTFGTQLLMYATPIIYPLSSVTGNLRLLLVVNPITHIIETFRYGFTGSGNLNFIMILYSLVVSLFIFFLGLAIFNKVEKSFIDSV